MAEKIERAWRRGAKHARYTEAQRAGVLADVPKLGIAGAARKHGVPPGNVSRWMRARPLVCETAARTAAPASPTHEAPSTSAPSAAAAPVADATRATGAASSATTSSALASAKPAKTIARSYTPSQRAEILEYAAQHNEDVMSGKVPVIGLP